MVSERAVETLLPAPPLVCKRRRGSCTPPVDILCQLWTTYGTDHVRITDSARFGLCSRTIDSGIRCLVAYPAGQSQILRRSVTSPSHNSSVYGAICLENGFAYAKPPSAERIHQPPDDPLTENRRLWKTWGADRNRIRTKLVQRTDKRQVLFRSPPKSWAATRFRPQGTLAFSAALPRLFDPMRLWPNTRRRSRNCERPRTNP
jgi:hypothetical protein